MGGSVGCVWMGVGVCGGECVGAWSVGCVWRGELCRWVCEGVCVDGSVECGVVCVEGSVHKVDGE